MARATGIGSLPGTDIREALRGVREILAVDDHLPYLPELPARGPGADMVGRAAGLLVDLPVDLQPAGWRLVERPGHDAARTAALWRQDLDELAEAFDGWEGDLKLQCTGPWTLAASLELTRGEKVLADPGAVRDLTGSLAEGIRVHLDTVQRLVPGARLVLQVDEPSLPAVLAGHLPTASGYGSLRAVDPQRAMNGLRDVLAAAGERPTVVHCCDRAVPLPLLRATGVGAVAMDVTDLTPQRWESVAATTEEGVALWAGCLATDGSGTTKAAAQLVERGWRDAGLSPRGLADVVATPTCGLAGLTPQGAWGVQRRAVEVAAEWTERAEG
ncbi:methionine synthase [Phycicoccus sp. Soil748]|uniref:methionine synthase n=1 Tax=Phycicoccus sp. Soil748 TaxID=1736397 RepID=UPI000703B97C|nr:methionine synthase [Phycicoccus sp. Soil748]KRE57242.1 methionine synthase [Phycicoccus sp. Soil748]